MIFEVMQSLGTQDEWRVEAINYDGGGEVYVTLFAGPNARSRAEEYATWKNHPSHSPEPPHMTKEIRPETPRLFFGPAGSGRMYSWLLEVDEIDGFRKVVVMGVTQGEAGELGRLLFPNIRHRVIRF